MPAGALADLTVLDLTHHIAGPYCTKLLATYGAEVMKIERPGSGDPRRGHFLMINPTAKKVACFYISIPTNRALPSI